MSGVPPAPAGYQAKVVSGPSMTGPVLVVTWLRVTGPGPSEDWAGAASLRRQAHGVGCWCICEQTLVLRLVRANAGRKGRRSCRKAGP